jgi:hypothetical protein
MRSVILCEGSTDFVLLQYYMRKVHGWEYKKNDNVLIKGYKARKCVLKKDRSELNIIGCGGCSRIPEGLQFILDSNSLSAEDEAYDRIVIITDRDEVETESEFETIIATELGKQQIEWKDDISNDKWIDFHYENGQGDHCNAKILLLVIPFEDTGAMETFLLDAVGKADSYDAQIISDCNQFVDNVDNQKKYLNKRRYITKAKFDVYFSVRTAAEQFVERQNILKNIPWEDYAEIQSSFKKLDDLTE